MTAPQMDGLAPMTETTPFTLERRFDAPRFAVWQAWTEPEKLARWYGPGVETIIHKLSIEREGAWLTEMRMGEQSMFQRADFTEVIEPMRLVMIQSNTDGKWNPMPNPGMPDWPHKMRLRVDFEDEAGACLMRLTWEPFEASEAELAKFAEMAPGMGKGWDAGMDELDAMLAELND